MAKGRGASAWWYGLAVVIGIATLLGVVWRAGSGRSLGTLRPKGVGYVDDGNVDSVQHLSKGTYTLVYLSDTMTSRDLVPDSDVQVRGGPVDDIRSLKVRNNPPDAKVSLAYSSSSTYTSPGYGPTTSPPLTAPPSTVVPGPGGTGTLPTTIPPTAPSTTSPYGPSTSVPSTFNGLFRGRAELAVFTVPEEGQYRISGTISGTSGQADQPDPEGVLALYQYRLRDEGKAFADGFFGFFGRVGSAVLIGLVGTGLTLALALVTASSRAKANRADRRDPYGWPAPPPGAWAPIYPVGPPGPPGQWGPSGPPGHWGPSGAPGPWPQPADRPPPPAPPPPAPGSWAPPDAEDQPPRSWPPPEPPGPG